MTISAESVAPRLGVPRSDWPFALLAAGIALVAYVRTMFPDMLVEGGGDAAKFQYLGRLLGTAHNPGYPLYILISHAFSYVVPIGTVAYRMNLLSGVAGALSVGAIYFLIRRLDCNRPVAVLTSVAFGLGRVYWKQAIQAEVYTMAALLLASFVAVLFRWGCAPSASAARSAGQSRRWRDLMLAIGISAIALGHHPTIALVAPGAVLYALLVDRHQALRPKTLLVGVLLVACGLAQYGFIVVRTVQQAPHVESHAASLGDLVNVIRGAQFQHEYLAYGARDVVRSRAAVVAGIGLQEAGAAGVLLLAVGVIAMARRRWRELTFLLCGIALDFVFAATYGAPDTDVFLIPAFVLGWPIAACGLQALLPAGHRHWRIAVIVGATLLLPGRQIYANYRANDHHLRYADGRELRMVLSQFPDRTAIVAESYTLDAAVTYALEVEKVGAAKQIVQIPSDSAEIRRALARGFEVYAFERSREMLEEAGGLDFAPVPLVVREGERLRAPERGVFRVIASRLCSDIGNAGWLDVSEIALRSAGRLAFRVDNFEPFDSRAVVYVESARTLNPALSRTAGTGEPRLAVGAFDDRQEMAALARAMSQKGEAAQFGLPASVVTTRIEVDVNDRGDFSSFVLALGDSVRRVWVNARVDRDNPRRARVCEDGRTGAGSEPQGQGAARYR